MFNRGFGEKERSEFNWGILKPFLFILRLEIFVRYLILRLSVLCRSHLKNVFCPNFPSSR
jgi:hypothetical protein